MKTKELIRQLQENDPSGELEVSMWHEDIHFVGREPWFYDGVQQVLIRDETLNGYNIIGGRYNTYQDKIVLHGLSFKACIWDDVDFPIDYSGLGENRTQRYKEQNEKTREAAIKFEADFAKNQ